MVLLKKNISPYQMKDIRQTKEYAILLQKTGWRIKKIKEVYYFQKKIFPFLKIIKIQRPEKINIAYIRRLKKTKGIINIIFEPKNSSQAKKIISLGFKKTNPYLPSKTLVLNLKGKDLYSNLEKDCKYAIKKTKDLVIEKSKDIKLFRKLWKKSVNFKRYIPSITNLEAIHQSFGEKSLFLLYKEGRAYSGAIFLRTKTTGYYWQAFTNQKARKKLVQYQIVWQGIEWAKKEGCKYFDFEGIYDSRFPNHSWLGFTHFKKSFGGKEKHYPGAFSFWSINLLANIAKITKFTILAQI